MLAMVSMETSLSLFNILTIAASMMFLRLSNKWAKSTCLLLPWSPLVSRPLCSQMQCDLCLLVMSDKNLWFKVNIVFGGNGWLCDDVTRMFCSWDVNDKRVWLSSSSPNWVFDCSEWNLWACETCKMNFFYICYLSYYILLYRGKVWRVEVSSAKIPCSILKLTIWTFEFSKVCYQMCF